MKDAADTKHNKQLDQHIDIFDVVIVGAGISGINTAYRIQSELPGTTYTVFEARDAIGGTWDFFKYPGLRSDSDLFTFEFSWRPWLANKPIVSVKSILQYMRASATAEGIEPHIQFGCCVKSANWSSKSQMWQLTVKSESGIKRASARFLVLGTGYYDYQQALTTVIPGLGNFKGRVVHPQFWPKDFDYTGLKVVCIGSGATAITLVPAMAQTASSVTMLQRSPLLFPTTSRKAIQRSAAKQLPENYPVDPDFSPRYNPFDQRVCFAPDGDFYKAIRDGRTKVVTDTIEEVVADSIILKNKGKIGADIIVTATGLKLQWAGGIDLTVDGQKYCISGKYIWHNAML
ncbi:hypothetical protein CLAIMM_09855 [Cladophialophora immunda]|nr:hypothetical protein CLAIMM_09855 [Cladophialophora immunda]